MDEWVKSFEPDAWARIIDGIQWSLTMIAVIVGWKGFRMAEKDAMELIKVCGENRRLKTEVVRLKLELELLHK